RSNQSRKRNFLSKRVRQSLVRNLHPFRASSSASTSPPTFLFLLNMQLSKNRHQANRQNIQTPSASASGPSEDRSLKAKLFSVNQLSLNSEENLFVASSVAAVVVERVIDPTSQNCQRRYCSFLTEPPSPWGKRNGTYLRYLFQWK